MLATGLAYSTFFILLSSYLFWLIYYVFILLALSPKQKNSQ